MLSFSASKLSKSQLFKLRKGYKAYQKDMAMLREEAAKKAKFTDSEYDNFLHWLKSDECRTMGPLVGKKAAELSRISPVKYQKYQKVLAELKKEYKEKKKLAKNSQFAIEASDMPAIKETMRELSFFIKASAENQRNAKSVVERTVWQDRLNSSRLDYARLYAMVSNSTDEAMAQVSVPAPTSGSDNQTSTVPKANLSPESRKLLDSSFKLSNFMNLIQGDEFFDWFSEQFSAWLADEEGAPTDDQVVEWIASHLS